MSENIDPKEMNKTNKQINKKPTQKIKKKKKRDWSFYAIIICLVIIAVPSIWIAWESISASMKGGSPLLGSRFDDDLEPPIEKEQLETLATKLEALETVESVEVNLTTATLRIYLLVPQETSGDTMNEIVDQAYATVIEDLPIATYFTTEGTRQMYDLDISVVNMKEATAETLPEFRYYLLTKSSIMSEPYTQVLSTPISPEFIDQLKRDQEAEKKAEKEAENDASSNSEEEGSNEE